MASQRDPNRYAVMCYVPIELAAKIKSYAYGKTVVNKHREGERVHTPTRPMAMSALCRFMGVDSAEFGVGC